MMMPLTLLFLPGTGLPDEFYAPLQSYLRRFGKVDQHRYQHSESMAAACKRLGAEADLFSPLRHEVCCGPISEERSLLGLKVSDAIVTQHETKHRGECVKALWRRTVVVGHSQGAGHALMLSQIHQLAGAIMVAGPADASRGRLAAWTRASYKTPLNRRMVLVHEKDGGSEAVVAHAKAGGMKVYERHEALQIKTGGYTILEKGPIPPLAAHGSLAGALTWAKQSVMYADYSELLSRQLVEWQNSEDLASHKRADTTLE